MIIHTSASIIFQHYYPPKLLSALSSLQELNVPLFLVGGAVRDFLLGDPPTDIDIAIPAKAIEIARIFAEKIQGTFVLLDEDEEVARVVWREFQIDFSSFREGTTSIEQDLRCRDFTINAMALPLNLSSGPFLDEKRLIDPCLGKRDLLQKKVIQPTAPDVFRKDPLRLLRAYRFQATIGFEIAENTKEGIEKDGPLLGRVSVERISYELNLIIKSSCAFACFNEMANSGLLFILFPELKDGVGLVQPGGHHLDVFQHNLEALNCLEKIIKDPGQYFEQCEEQVVRYFDYQKRLKWLKWAAILHDIGKPACHNVKGQKITFYGHDSHGADLFLNIAGRFKWSKQDTIHVMKLIKLHMWPFHLFNAMKNKSIKAKACLKLYKAAGEDLTGLFVLAMADSLAASGSGKPKGMEKELVCLFEKVITVIEQKITPLNSEPPVLTGHDLIKEFGLVPGPVIGKILRKLEEVQVCKNKMSRSQAVAWVKEYLQSYETVRE